MTPRTAVRFGRVAAFVGTAYLLGAIGYRISVRLGFDPEPLGLLYLTLPGALAGSTLYSAWTGLRNRPQGAEGMVLAGAVGAIAAAILEGRWSGLLPYLPPAAARAAQFVGPGFFQLLCDLSGIVFLFSLFLAAYVPLARRGEPEGPEAAETS